MEFLISDILDNNQYILPEEHPILIVEPLGKSKDFRVKYLEMLFDKFQFKGVFFQKVSFLTLVTHFS